MLMFRMIRKGVKYFPQGPVLSDENEPVDKNDRGMKRMNEFRVWELTMFKTVIHD